jgi:hypothetical protein
MTDNSRWPALPIDEWQDTRRTLHLWSQVVGKIRLEQEPFLNHWWHVTLYVTARGLTTSMMPYRDGRTFSIDFDFVDDRLVIAECDGRRVEFKLEPMTVADFNKRVMDELRELGISVKIHTLANEIPQTIHLDRDVTPRAYDRAYAERFWRALLQVDRVCKIFRAEFLGKASPVHFFWGSFDLAVTRFSGRVAPPHPGGFPHMPDWATREGYSHEEQSVGFWPGGDGAEAIFYAYAYPEPKSFPQAHVVPSGASWNAQLKEFVLPYETVRTSSDPDAALLDFFRSTYEAGARLAGWDPALVRVTLSALRSA